MAIPENQLETWSRQGTTASASALYERIRNALQNDAALRNRNFEVFLQGSYRNSTNIRGDSDVDVVDSEDARLSGDYFTGRGRETRGEITLHRVSRELLGFDAALKKKKQ